MYKNILTKLWLKTLKGRDGNEHQLPIKRTFLNSSFNCQRYKDNHRVMSYFRNFSSREDGNCKWEIRLGVFVVVIVGNLCRWKSLESVQLNDHLPDISAFLPPATGMRRVIESLCDMLKLCPWDSSTSHDIISCLCLEGFTYGLIERRVLLRNAFLWRQLLRHECEACGLINFFCPRYVFGMAIWLFCLYCLNLVAVSLYLEEKVWCVRYLFLDLTDNISREYNYDLLQSLCLTFTTVITERRGGVVNIPASYSGGPRV
jgi:hypothetical protein